MKLLIIGSNGMLGHSLFRYFSKNHKVIGTSRSKPWNKEILEGYDIKSIDKFEDLISREKPDVVLNCVGIIKQLKESKDYEISIQSNSLWPHQLATICAKYNAKMIHFSTDCVFSGKDGMYTEESIADSRDLYGLSKYLGEVNYENALTIRTSIIGHELSSSVSLVDWFLSQEKECKGFRKAIYTGFPTNSLARILEENILPGVIAGDLFGVYQVSSEPINKYDLLCLIAKKYKKDINIIPFDGFVLDRSLDSTKFRNKVGFEPKNWEFLVNEMHELYVEMKGDE